MLSFYSGTPGSGKSLHVARRMAARLRAGKPVIANFDFNAKLCARQRGREVPFFSVTNDNLTPEYLIYFARDWWLEHNFREDGILLVIDEAQLLFNAREWSKQGRSDWLSFFTQHRKYGYEIVLVAQFDRMIDRQIRSLIEYEYIHRKVSNYGSWGKLLSVWCLNKLFVAVKMWYPLSEKVGSEWFVAKRRIWRLYDTYNTFGAEQSAPDGDRQASLPGLDPGLEPGLDPGLGQAVPKKKKRSIALSLGRKEGSRPAAKCTRFPAVEEDFPA